MSRLVSACLAVVLLGAGNTFGSVGFDFSKDPDPNMVLRSWEASGISSLREKLAQGLGECWQPRAQARGSSRKAVLESWLELYRWIDLLATDEASVTKRWLSRHISAERRGQGGSSSVQATIHEPGAPLVRCYDPLQHDVIERMSADPGMLGKALDALVSKPFSPRNGPLEGRLEKRFIRETIADRRFLAAWCDHFSEDDFAPKVLENLQAIWKTAPADFHEFLNLALAISLVMDQPAPSYWPHHQVRREDVPRAEIPPERVFLSCVSDFRAGKLARDPRTLGVRELMFVVDSPLDPMERAWVQSDRKASGQDPPKAYDSVVYDEVRIAKERFVWPWGRYGLEQIRKHGGICIDQAYYSAMLGKIRGLPSMVFAGLGKDGGHAWTGYLRRGGGWDFRVGRPSGQGLATGETLDPGNWAPVNDHDMEYLVRSSFGEARAAAVRELVMASVFRRKRDATGEGSAIESAMAMDRREPEVWDAKEDWLSRTGSPRSEFKAHHAAAIRNFSDSRDLKAKHEQALAVLEAAEGNGGGSEKLMRKILSDNLGERSDLSAQAAANLLLSRIKAGDYKGAFAEYRRILKTVGSDGGGDFFHRVSVPFSNVFLSKGRPDLARRVIREAYETIRPRKGSLLDRDFKEAWEKAGGL